ncbi:MAG: MFS transporter [Pseudomonadales bacterium]|jgi:MFS family permease|nr:MFS transporter [Pseudomonadales bacterium]
MSEPAGAAYYAPMSTSVTRLGRQLNNIFRPSGKVFYGWWIVLACAGVQWLAALTWMHSYGGYALKLQADFGWSMSVLSLAFALTRLESGLLGPLQGWLVDRYGPRRILIIGTVIFSIGFFVFSLVESITTYFVAFILIALGSSLGGFATLMVSIVSWFDAHRAKAIAMSQIGFSAGGLCVPFVMMGLEAFGWRSMALYSGILILVLGIPLVSLVRHRPEDYGEVPDGVRADGEEAESDQLKRSQSQVSLTWQQAIREPSFWLISTGHGLSLLTVSSMLAHLIPYLTFDLGYEPVNAGFVFALMTAVQMGGLFLGGIIGDRFDKRIICTLCMMGHFVGLIALTYGAQPSLVLLFALAHGLAWGVRAPLMVALRADYFGPKSFGTIMGISSLIVMIGMTLGPLFSGVMFDIYGNYNLAFTSIAFCSLAGGLCFWFAKPPKLIAEQGLQDSDAEAHHL